MEKLSPPASVIMSRCIVHRLNLPTDSRIHVTTKRSAADCRASSCASLFSDGGHAGNHESCEQRTQGNKSSCFHKAWSSNHLCGWSRHPWNQVQHPNVKPRLVPWPVPVNPKAHESGARATANSESLIHPVRLGSWRLEAERFRRREAGAGGSSGETEPKPNGSARVCVVLKTERARAE